jgi:predicted branched-subunit amino acid permease
MDAGTHKGVINDAIAVGIATGVYGISFGAISVASGLTVWQTCALSLLMFTGASQYALVGVIGAGGAPMTGAAAALLLGTRNALYGLKLAPMLGWKGWRRLGAAQLTIDESTAMSVLRPTHAQARLGFVSTGLSVFVLWNAATLFGAVLGDRMGDPRVWGLDAAVGGAFLALLWPRLSSKTNRIAGVLGAALALSLVQFTPAGVPVLAAATVAIGMGLLTRSETDPTEIPDEEHLP